MRIEKPKQTDDILRSMSRLQKDKDFETVREYLEKLSIYHAKYAGMVENDASSRVNQGRSHGIDTFLSEIDEAERQLTKIEKREKS